MKRNDIILIAGILFIALIGYVWFSISHGKTDDEAKVYVTRDGEVIREYKLNENVDEIIEHDDRTYNRIVINDREVEITEASCPDKICVYHNKISKNGETIVCLPNKLVITVVNNEENDVDGVTN